MGGTNLRVCEIILTEEKSEFDIIQSKYRMPEELKTGDAEELFEYIADCLQAFIDTHHADQNLTHLPLGFTFSYPATQDSIDHGVLQRWTKGFDVAGVEGHDVVPMFEAALQKRVRDTTSPSRSSLMILGMSYQAYRFNQRHYWNTSCFCLHRHFYEDWMHFWHWL